MIEMFYGDHKTFFVCEQISVAIIRGNALAITASSRRYDQELIETLTFKMEIFETGVLLHIK